MKSLTLIQLCNAINTVSTNGKYTLMNPDRLKALLGAKAYMTGDLQDFQEMSSPGQTEPQDPREILTAVGYQW